jgi:hypothetical protein
MPPAVNGGFGAAKSLDRDASAAQIETMEKLFSGSLGFALCVLIGILIDQVALGILAGLFLGAFLGIRKPKATEDTPDA